MMRGNYLPEVFFLVAVFSADNVVAATAMSRDLLLLFVEGLIYGALATLLIGVYVLHRVNCDINSECSIAAINPVSRNEVLIASLVAAAILLAGAGVAILMRSPIVLDYTGLAAYIYGLAFLLIILPHAVLKEVTLVYGWGHVLVFGLAAVILNAFLGPAVNVLIIGITRSLPATYPVVWSLMPEAWGMISHWPGILLSWGDIVATLSTAHLFTYLARRLI
jgi:hypothetical protein